MSSYRRSVSLILFKVSDHFLFLFALFAGHLLAKNESISMTYLETAKFDLLTLIFLAFIILYAEWLRYICQFYDSRRLENGRNEIRDILKMSTIFVLSVLPLTILYRPSHHAYLSLLYFWIILNVLTISFRTVLRSFLRRLRASGINTRNFLIVGSNKSAYDWGESVMNKKDLGIIIKGFIDNEIFESNATFDYLGKIDDLPVILQNQEIDEVVIALPIKSKYGEIQKTIFFSEEQGVNIRYAYPLFDFATYRPNDYLQQFCSDFENIWCNSPNGSPAYALKQTLDLIIASTLLVLLAPLFVAISIIIKITSKGPIFFIQDRVGLNKRKFKLIKFRTMVENAEDLQQSLEDQNEMDGAAFKIKDDPRITGIGRFLRKTSLDELPQLFNVLKCEISLVGPRPLPIRDYKHFDYYWYSRRQSVLPGITCTWQISGRNNISFEEWMKLDLDYIQNWSLTNDLKILLLTIPAVLKGDGAR